jgi:hypothetical protein
MFQPLSAPQPSNLTPRNVAGCPRQPHLKGGLVWYEMAAYRFDRTTPLNSHHVFYLVGFNVDWVE